MNAYLISYDTNLTSTRAAHAAITESGAINEWWHYLNGTYIVTSNKNLDDLTQAVKIKWPGDDSLLIMPATKPTGGWLPKDAWLWINTRLS